MTKRKARYIRTVILKISVIVAFVAVLIVAGVMWLKKDKLLITNKVELCIHESFNAKDYLSKKYQNMEGTITGDIDTNKVGEYELTYQFAKKESALKVNVVDRLDPVVTLKEVTLIEGDTIDPNEVIETMQDDSNVTVRFSEEYDFSVLGEHVVKVEVEDEYGNKTTQETKVYIEKKDTTPPVMQGLSDMSAEASSPIDYYEGVNAIDNQDPEPEFTADFSQVKESVPGTYEIYYTAKDRQGNEAIYTRSIKITKVPKSDKVVYLTIDDGPSFNTPEILNILNRYNAKATFFVTGMCPEYYPYIKTAYDQGHAIGMHTYSHDYGLIYSDDNAYIDDLNKITDVIENQIGHRPTLFRFPGGSSNTVSSNYNTGIVSRLVDYANRNDLIYYDWNADIGDGNAGLSAQDMLDRAIQSGDGINRVVMLMHDGRGSAESVKALPAIIEYYQGQGYVFKALDESAPTSHHRIYN